MKKAGEKYQHLAGSSFSKCILLYFSLFLLLTPPVLAKTSNPRNDSATLITLIRDTTLSGPEKLIATLNLSRVYRTFDPQKAQFYDSLSIKIAKTLSKKSTVISGIRNAALNFQKSGQYKKADILYKYLKTKINDSSLTELGDYYYDLATNNYLWGKYKNAATNFKKSRSYFEQMADKPGIAKTLVGEAKVWCEYSDYFQAVGILQRANDIYDQLGNEEHLAEIQVIMGQIMKNWGQMDRAKQYYNYALAYYQRNSDKYHESMVRLLLGDLLIQGKKYLQALMEYREALKYAKISQYKMLYARSLRKMGEVYFSTHNFNSALFYQRQAYKILKQVGNSSEIGKYYFDMGNIQYKLKNYLAATHYADSALSISKKTEIKDLQLKSLKLLTNINVASDHYKRAYFYLTRYNKVFRNVFSEKNRKMVSDMEVHYEADQKAKEYDLLKKHNLQTQLYLAKEKNLQTLLIVITIFIVIILLLIVFFIQYENKINKKSYAMILAKNKKITSQQKKLEALNDELFKSRESYRSIVENATIGMYQISPEGKILFANKTLLRMLSLKDINGLQEQPFLMIRDEKRKHFIELLKKQERIIGREDVWKINNHKDIYISESAWLIKDKQENILYYEGIVEDISKRKIAEKKVQQTQTMLEQKNQELVKRNEEFQKAKNEAEEANAAKTMFLANVSHEIRTPLNSIIGFANLMRPLVKTQQEKNFVHSILISSNSLLALINDILDLSKIQAGKLELNFEPAYIPRIITEIERIFYPQVESKGLNFTITMSPLIEDFFIVDRIRLRQVLFNIIGNAIKFTEKGSVNIKAEATSCKGEPAFFDLCFSVRDTGPGIPKEEQPYIFDAFKQASGNTSNQTPGTGLGLSISQRLVKMMDGRIDLESNIGEGTTFTIYLKHIKKVEKHTAIKELNDDVEQIPSVEMDHEYLEKNCISGQTAEEIRFHFGKTYNKVLKHKSIEEIVKFGEVLFKFSKEKQCGILEEESSKLLMAAKQYDIETLEDILEKMKKYFPQRRKSE